MPDKQPPNKKHYKFDLDIQVQTCVQEYLEDMESWYREGGATDSEIGAVIFEQAQSFSQHVLQSTKELSHESTSIRGLAQPEFRKFIHEYEGLFIRLAKSLEQKGLDPESARRFVRAFIDDISPDNNTVLKLAWEILQAQSLSDAVERSKKEPTRLFLLASLDMPGQSTDRIRLFLKQVSKCFALGLDAPAIAFCRGALDVALKDIGIDRGNLKKRIDIAHQRAILDDLGKEHAHSIRNRGNDTLHDKPVEIDDALAVIRKTLVCLRQIEDGNRRA